MKPFEIGDRAHFPGQGLGRIDREFDREGTRVFYLDMDSGRGIGVPVAEASTILWRLPSTEEATRLRRSLFTSSAPDLRPFQERYEHFVETMKSGTVTDYIALMGPLLARGAPESFGERKLMIQLEDNVTAPIAEALGEDPRGLYEEVAAFQRDNALPSP